MWGRYFGSHVVFSHVNMTLVESVHDSLVARRPSLVASQEGNLAALSLAKKTCSISKWQEDFNNHSLVRHELTGWSFLLRPCLKHL